MPPALWQPSPVQLNCDSSTPWPKYVPWPVASVPADAGSLMTLLPNVDRTVPCHM